MGRRYLEVMRELVDALADGDVAWLAGEQELAARFGTSRGTVREAIRALEERGLVEVSSGRGQRVLERERWNALDPDVLRALVERGRDASGTLRDALDARTAVERLAVERGGCDLDGVRGSLDAMLRARGSGDPFVAADAGFHHTLAVGGNPLLARAIEPLHRVLAAVRHARAPEREPAVVRQHQRIVEALASRDPEFAREAVEAHARQVARWLGASAL